MSNKELKAALANGGGVKKYLDTDDNFDNLSPEELLEEAYINRAREGSSGAEIMERLNRRNTLIQKAGFDFFDVRELMPHPRNSYSLDIEQIKNLAALIYESKVTTPLVVRTLPEGYQIIDGQRRCEAHKILGEQYGESWFMVPVRCFPLNAISDEDAEFILHAENIGQRNMTASERAKGFAAVANRIVEQRKNDPSLKGKKTKEILAEQFGISERSASMELNIGKSLIPEASALLDDKKITKVVADAIAKLDENNQIVLVEYIQENNPTTKEISNLVSNPNDIERTVKQGNTTLSEREEDINNYLKRSLNALKRANRTPGQPSFAITGQIKELVQEIERKRDL